ncbi:Uncharacterised protein [Streptococcus pneumoniae]|nr:Uncharacterised protein [Streptococcus pneumoniae]
MTKQPNKKKFEVLENETITDCLARMEQEGYAPSRRMEIKQKRGSHVRYFTEK